MPDFRIQIERRRTEAALAVPSAALIGLVTGGLPSLGRGGRFLTGLPGCRARDRGRGEGQA